jgi:hypothetical protein
VYKMHDRIINSLLGPSVLVEFSMTCFRKIKDSVVTGIDAMAITGIETVAITGGVILSACTSFGGQSAYGRLYRRRSSFPPCD